MSSDLRRTGLDVTGDVLWGTHFCQFYESREDLEGILVPYFKVGLEDNEYCMWVTAEPLGVQQARAALKKEVPHLDSLIDRGQIEILDYSDWYTKSGRFDSEEVLAWWVERLGHALDRGFEGLRLTENTFWLERADWNSFQEYERQVDHVIGSYRMLAICSYSLDKCSASDVIDVVSAHGAALVRKQSAWDLIESTGCGRAEEALREEEERYHTLYSSMTEGLAIHEVIWDESGKPTDFRVLDVNPAYESILGLPKEDVVGRNASEIYQEEWPKYLETYARVATTGESVSFEAHFEAIDEYYRISAFSLGKGKFALAFSDITERKRAERRLRDSEERLRAFYDQSPIGIALYDPDGHLTGLNQAFSDMFMLPETAHTETPGLFEEVGLGDKTRTRLRRRETYRWEGRIDLDEVRERGHYPTGRQGVVHIQVHLTPLGPQGGSLRGYVLQVQDITDRKRAEEALKGSEAWLRSLLESSPDIIYVINPQHRITYVNRVLAGYDPGRVMGSDPADWLPAEERENYGRRLEQVFSEGEAAAFDNIGYGAEGYTAWYSTQLVPIKQDGQTVSVLLIARDITERKRAEDRVERLNRVLRAIRNVNQLLVREKDTGRLIQEACRHLVEQRGYSSAMIVLTNEEGVPRTWAETGAGEAFLLLAEELEDGKLPPCCQKAASQEGIHHVMDIAMACAACPIAAGCVTNDAMCIRLKHDEVTHGYLVAVVEHMPSDDEGEQTLFAEVAADIAFGLHGIAVEQRRKEMEEALVASEAKYRDLYDNAPVVYYSVGTDALIKDSNKAAQSCLGYSEDEMRGMKVFDLYAEESRLKAETLFARRFKEGLNIEDEEMVYRSKDGLKVYGLLSLSPIFGENGEVVASRSVVKDITERKRAEEALRESETRYATLVEQSRDGVVVVQDGKMVFVNSAHAEITGYSVEEMIGVSYLDMIDPEFRDEVIKRQRARAGGEPVGPVLETRIRCKDGTVKYIESSTAPIQYGGKLSTLVIVRDITERKHLNQERQRADRLESIGTLAGGIAHDFNNFLTGVIGNIGLAQRYMDQKSEAYEVLEEAERASVEAKGLTQQLLTFAKGGTPVREPASIGSVIVDSATFALRGSKVKCQFDIADDLWFGEIDVGQISQVISNLVMNADEAMPGGGTIRIGARNRVIGDGSGLPLKKGDYVEITLEDEGVGISRDHLDRIFDPYFTTKQKGSGLGLATAYSIIKNHGGHMTVESELGAGTTFRVYLPASKQKVRVSKKKAGKQTGLWARGRVLVMDDEEMIRKMLRKTLPLAGYEVEVAGDGAEAIGLYARARESGQPFDVVILDLTVPGGMSGKETMEKLLEIDPDVKAIVSSGYSTDPIMSNFREYGFSAVAVKPYSIEALEETLARLLAAGQ